MLNSAKFFVEIILKIGFFFCRISAFEFGNWRVGINDTNNPNEENLVPEPIETSIVTLDAVLLDQNQEQNAIVVVQDEEVTPSRRKRKR